MIRETRPSVTDQTDHLDETEDKQSHRLRRALVAGTIAVSGLVVAACGNESSGAAASPQTVHLPAPTTTTEAAPVTTTSPKTTNGITADKFPFTDANGKKFESMQAYQQTQELRVADYPGDNYNKALVPALAQKLNDWQRSGLTESNAAFKTSVSPSGKKGFDAVAEVYDEAFSGALSDSPSFNDVIERWHKVYAGQYEYDETVKSPTPYVSKITLDKTSYGQLGDIIQYDLNMQQTNNLPNSTPGSQAVRIVLKKAVGVDGATWVWHIVSYGPSPQA